MEGDAHQRAHGGPHQPRVAAQLDLRRIVQDQLDAAIASLRLGIRARFGGYPIQPDARAAQAAWLGIPMRDRCARMRALREQILSNRNILADAVVAESGKPRVEALFADIFVAVDTAASSIARLKTSPVGEYPTGETIAMLPASRQPEIAWASTLRTEPVY